MSFTAVVKHERNKAHRRGEYIGWIEARKRARAAMLDGFADEDQAHAHCAEFLSTDTLYTPDGLPFTVRDLRYALNFEELAG